MPPEDPLHDCAPHPTSVKFAISGIVNGCWLYPLSQPVPLQPSLSIPSTSVEQGARAGARHELGRVVADEVLEPAGESVGHVEHVVAGFVGDKMIAVQTAAKELVCVVETGQRLEKRHARA